VAAEAQLVAKGREATAPQVPPASGQAPAQESTEPAVHPDTAVQPGPGASLALQRRERERSVCNGISSWLAPVAMVVTQDIALRGWFRRVAVIDRSHLPLQGPVLLAPTHRARWDALLLPHVAGRRVTGRDCRFMVTVDEMRGLQGWFLHRLGCFPVNQSRPSLASLRYAVDLLAGGQQLVVFPEGRIRRDGGPIRLQQGLARLALLAASQGVSVPVVPVGIAYGHRVPRPRDSAALCFGEPLVIQGQGREAAHAFSQLLAQAMAAAEASAASALGGGAEPSSGHT
jgi:1-acyl-sn-glycerol-3-phosphate acyltransferase